MPNLATSNIDHLATTIARMPRRQVKREIMTFKGSFKLDFTETFLDSLTVERLRHILMAAQLQQTR